MPTPDSAAAPEPFLPVYDRDLVIVEGKGVRLFDQQGRRYLDFAAGIAVNGLGYGDRKVTAAIRAQAGKLIHTSNLFHTEPALALARRLVELTFPSKVFLCNSGTEANEAAIKLARRVLGPQGRTGLIAFEGGFHGRTMGAVSMTWKAKYREPFAPLLPGVRFCPWGDLAAVEAAIDPTIAAVFIEPVQGEGGVRPATPEFLRGLSELCRKQGVLLVADEIQCGLGRTGTMFAYEQAGITPDLLLLAKPLGGGLPLGAVLLREDLAHHFHAGDHGSTFGGNPVACAAGLAVLERLTSPGFLEGVRTRGEQLRRGLKKIARTRKGRIADVRGLGLMYGVELTADPKPVIDALRARGVLVTRAGDRVVRLVPPLIVKAGDVREFLAAFEAVLDETGG